MTQQLGDRLQGNRRTRSAVPALNVFNGSSGEGIYCENDFQVSETSTGNFFFVQPLYNQIYLAEGIAGTVIYIQNDNTGNINFVASVLSLNSTAGVSGTTLEGDTITGGLVTGIGTGTLPTCFGGQVSVTTGTTIYYVSFTSNMPNTNYGVGLCTDTVGQQAYFYEYGAGSPNVGGFYFQTSNFTGKVFWTAVGNA